MIEKGRMVPLRRIAWMLGLLACGCGGAEDDGAFLPALSQYHFFEGALADQRAAAGLMVFDVNAPLYSDNASKLRFIALPPGGRITFDASERWKFPEGTTLIKTFFYPRDARDATKGRRLVETRLLQLQGGAWN